MKQTPQIARLLCISTLLFLSSCQTTPDTQKTPAEVIEGLASPDDSEDQQTVRTRPMDDYILPSGSDDSGLDTAAELLRQGQPGAASVVLKRIDNETLGVDQQTRRRIIEAEILLAVNGDSKAAEVLGPAPATARQDIMATYYLVRARINIRRGQNSQAINDLLLRSSYLTTDEAVSNQQLLWDLLMTMSEQQMRRMLVSGMNPELEGWIDLAIQIGRNHSPVDVSTVVNNWRIANLAHPADTRVLEQIISELTERTPIRKVALLLPESSHYRVAASAIREGFTAINNDLPASSRYQVLLYDYGKDIDLVALYYRQAANEGADVIIGPLGRGAVEKLLYTAEMDKPTILLSPVPDHHVVENEMVFQFSLSQELEAQQTARRAWLQGHRRAVMIYPDTPLGQRMATAFRERFEQLGGEIVNNASYIAAEADYSAIISELLGINESQQRIREIEAVLGGNVQAEARRRQDIDFIFLPAETRNARLIKPVLDFYYALDLPIYATSRIFAGKVDNINDADLNRIRFPDMPWMVASNIEIESMRTFLQGNWPHSESRYDRLYALGMDIHSLLPLLQTMQTNPLIYHQGVTGNLYVEDGGIINKQMLWSVFTQGTPHLLDRNNRYQGRYSAKKRYDTRKKTPAAAPVARPQS